MIESTEAGRDLCRCGHDKAEHDLGSRGCCWASDEAGEWCYCLAFEEVAWGEFEDRVAATESDSGLTE